MANKTLGLNSQLYNYLLSNSLREPDILQELRSQMASHPEGIMQIAPEQGQFMALLVQLMAAKKALEIGVFTGYSSLAIALALPDDGKLIACDVNKEYTDIAKQYWRRAGIASKVDLRIAPGRETLEQLLENGEAGTFDFIFIDADKKTYQHYYERSLQLLRRGGLIAIDNVLWGGRVANPEVRDNSTEAIRRFNQMLYNDKRVKISLIPIADGLTLALKCGE